MAASFSLGLFPHLTGAENPPWGCIPSAQAVPWTVGYTAPGSG